MKTRLSRNWWSQLWWWSAIRASGALLALLGLGCAAWAVDGEMNEMRAIAALRQGGQVVYMRHADRARGEKEALSQFSTAAEYNDCRRQRNLTSAGRRQAVDLGENMRKLGVPVGEVYANAQCRTRDTAILAFGFVKVDPNIFDLGHVRMLFNRPPAPATNTIIVGNDYQLRELTGVDLDVGEMALIKPDGRGGFTVTARLDLEDWDDAANPNWWDRL
jgi:hypothetical protein